MVECCSAVRVQVWQPIPQGSKRPSEKYPARAGMYGSLRESHGPYQLCNLGTACGRQPKQSFSCLPFLYDLGGSTCLVQVQRADPVFFLFGCPLCFLLVTSVYDKHCTGVSLFSSEATVRAQQESEEVRWKYSADNAERARHDLLWPNFVQGCPSTCARTQVLEFKCHVFYLWYRASFYCAFVTIRYWASYRVFRSAHNASQPFLVRYQFLASALVCCALTIPDAPRTL